MESIFPGVVDVRYIDILSPKVQPAYEEQLQQFGEHKWPYPVTLVDGEVVSVGSVSVFALARAVEKARRRDNYGR